MKEKVRKILFKFWEEEQGNRLSSFALEALMANIMNIFEEDKSCHSQQEEQESKKQ